MGDYSDFCLRALARVHEVDSAAELVVGVGMAGVIIDLVLPAAKGGVRIQKVVSLKTVAGAVGDAVEDSLNEALKELALIVEMRGAGKFL